jgi:hypothetical protein
MVTCPECGADLDKLDPVAHAIAHWGERCPDPELYPEAAKRYQIVKSAGGGK